jgi:hypothetical protein
MRGCIVVGCTRPHLARGYCNRHYKAWRQHGDPLISRKHQQFTDTQKLCSLCELWKPHSDFSPHKATTSGLHSLCKPCQGVRVKESAERNRTPERVQAAAERRRRRTLAGYGITPEEYDAIVERQGGGCICGSIHPGGRWRRFHVDHDHQTNRVRGVLCHGCNTALGLVDEDPARLYQLMVYLKEGGS